MHKDTGLLPYNLELTVSVFDVNDAVSMMIDSKMFNCIGYVHITPEYKSGEWCLSDTFNEVLIHSSCQ